MVFVADSEVLQHIKSDVQIRFTVKNHPSQAVGHVVITVSQAEIKEMTYLISGHFAFYPNSENGV